MELFAIVAAANRNKMTGELTVKAKKDENFERNRLLFRGSSLEQGKDSTAHSNKKGPLMIWEGDRGPK